MESIISLLKKIEDCDFKYAILRSADELLSDDSYLSEGHDIDIICDSRDYRKLAAFLGAKRESIGNDLTTVNVEINGMIVGIDIVCAGKGPYGAKWERAMIRNRVLHPSGCCHVLSDEDHYYSLLFHSYADFGEIKDRYVDRLAKLKNRLSSNGIEVLMLDDFLVKNSYPAVGNVANKKVDLKRSIAKLVRKFLIMFATLIICIIMAVALMMASYAIPIKQIDKNVASSAKMIQREGPYPGASWWTTQLDNVTDSAMMLEAACDTDEPLIVKTMKSHLGVIEDADLAKTMVDHYINGKDFDRIGSYPRYWHGYLIVLKPLFWLTNYMGIRVINGIFQLLIVFVICRLLKTNGKSSLIFSFILSYMMLMPLALAMSLQFSTCFYVSMLGAIAVLSLDTGKIDNFGYIVFFLLGVATSFFDFLTYPIATLGIPMTMYLIKGVPSLKKKIFTIVGNSFCWGFGYVGMWASKWILATFITGNNVLGDALETFAYRTSGQSGSSYALSRISCELRNYFAFFKTPVTIVFFVILFSTIFKVKNNHHIKLEKELKYFCHIALLPLCQLCGMHLR